MVKDSGILHTISNTEWLIFNCLSCWHWLDSRGEVHSYERDGSWVKMGPTRSGLKNCKCSKGRPGCLTDSHYLFGVTALCLVILAALQQGSSHITAEVHCCSRTGKTKRRLRKMFFFFYIIRHKGSNWHKAARCFHYSECVSREAHRCHVLKRTKSPRYVLSECCSDSHAQSVAWGVGRGRAGRHFTEGLSGRHLCM